MGNHLQIPQILGHDVAAGYENKVAAGYEDKVVAFYENKAEGMLF